MSLNQLPESSQKSSSRFLLPAAVLTAISVALSACNKSETPSSEVVPHTVAPIQQVDIPSSVIGIIPENSTRSERKVLIADVTRLAIGNGDPMKTPYMRDFAPDESHGDQWQLQRMVIGFGPDAGMQFGLGKQQGNTISRWEITDPFNTGDIAFSEKSENTPSPAVDGIAMTHFDKNMGVDEETQAMFTAALLQAKKILEAEITQQAQTSSK